MIQIFEGVNLLQTTEEMGQISDGYHTFDELYDHRCNLLLLSMLMMPKDSWWSNKHSDGEQWEGWFIAGINLPTGAITYHLPIELYEVVAATGAKELEFAPVWDGHTSSDVIERIQKHIVTTKKENMNYGEAIEAMKAGKRVARAGWNGSGMYAYYVPGGLYSAQCEHMKGIFKDDMVPYRPYMALKTAQDDIATWTASGSDQLAEDWFIYS